MKNLSPKEEVIMNLFWEHGPLFVKELLAFYDEPKPHFNTVSTFVRQLEEQGFVGHHAYGTTYQYYPIISRTEYHKHTVRGVINKYFNNSYLDVVSAFVNEEDISIDELKKLIRAAKNTKR